MAAWGAVVTLRWAGGACAGANGPCGGAAITITITITVTVTVTVVVTAALL